MNARNIYELMKYVDNNNTIVFNEEEKRDKIMIEVEARKNEHDSEIKWGK